MVWRQRGLSETRRIGSVVDSRDFDWNRGDVKRIGIRSLHISYGHGGRGRYSNISLQICRYPTQAQKYLEYQ